MTALACYALRNTVEGHTVTDFDSVVDLDGWAGIPPIQQVPDPQLGVDARLYQVPARPDQPEWVPFLRGGFGQTFTAPTMSIPGALLLVRFSWREETRYMAFAFGSGRYLLRKSAIERRFGVHVALNIMFDGDTRDAMVEPNRLRSVDAKRVAANPVRMRHQTSQRAEFEAFNLNRDQDFLHGVTGRPRATEVWGSNVTGSDHLSLNIAVTFGDLPALCQRLLDMREQASYKEKFAWIDDVNVVTDPATVERLVDEVISRIAHRTEEFELALPNVVEWDRIARFRLPYERHPAVDRIELRLQDLISVLERKHRLDDINHDSLKRQRIDAVDGDGALSYQWRVWDCLTGEFSVSGRTYVLDDGDFYEVQRDYLDELDAFIDRNVRKSDLTLPGADVRMTEAEYNKFAAETAQLLLLDTRTVQVRRSTTPIEICDLLSRENQYIHVKRKLGSSLLSHLFAQGATSAELLQSSPEFRSESSKMVKRVCKETLAQRSGVRASDFAFISRDPRPSEVEVIYVVIADWRSKTLSRRLPFFSKLTLRRTVQDLSGRGFSVTHVPVQTHH